MCFFTLKRIGENRGSLNQSFIWLLFCLFSFLFIMAGREVKAGELVYGEYLSAAGTKIQLRITTGTPPPSHIIVAQRIPPGITVVSTQPAAQKIDVGKGTVKWLLKNVVPGSQVLNITLLKPINQSTLNAELQYRDPATGQYVKTQVFQ